MKFILTLLIICLSSVAYTQTRLPPPIPSKPIIDIIIQKNGSTLIYTCMGKQYKDLNKFKKSMLNFISIPSKIDIHLQANSNISLGDMYTVIEVLKDMKFETVTLIITYKPGSVKQVSINLQHKKVALPVPPPPIK